MAKISINMKSGKLVKKEIIVGIDLGTTNSLVAYIDDEVKIVKDKSNKNTLVPSILYLGENNHFIVGDEAKAKLVSDPQRTIYSVKRLLGKNYGDLDKYKDQLAYEIIDEEDSLVKIRMDNHFYSPVELSAEILKYLKSRVEIELNVIITRAVVTVPAYFDDAQRQATRDAGKLAGLDILRIINEPTAASLAYGFDNNSDSDELIAVYDLGGGTFDISILKLHDGVFDVFSTNGDTFLGGDDIDLRIIDLWKKKYHISDNQLDDNVNLRQSLRIKAESAKKALSNSMSYTSEDGSFQLSLEELNELIAPLVETTIEKCKEALKDAALKTTDINKVILVGGSTRIPLVKSELKSFFNCQINDKINPDEVVAIGAAIQADILAGNNDDLLLLDVTPLSLGIETMGGLMDTIIPRNSKIPHAAGRNYTTSVDGQSKLKISVYQGERELVENNRNLGEFILSGIPPMPAGLPKIEVQFIINADGILKVKAKELRSETQTEIEIKSQYGISEQEMGRMLLDSIKNAESDIKLKAIQEAKNEGNALFLSGQKFLTQNQSWLNPVELEKLRTLIDNLKLQIQESDKDGINVAIQDLNNFSNPLAEKAMDFVIKNALKGKDLS